MFVWIGNARLIEFLDIFGGTTSYGSTTFSEESISFAGNTGIRLYQVVSSSYWYANCPERTIWSSTWVVLATWLLPYPIWPNPNTINFYMEPWVVYKIRPTGAGSTFTCNVNNINSNNPAPYISWWFSAICWQQYFLQYCSNYHVAFVSYIFSWENYVRNRSVNYNGTSTWFTQWDIYLDWVVSNIWLSWDNVVFTFLQNIFRALFR